MAGEDLWDVPWFDAYWMLLGPFLGLLLTALPPLPAFPSRTAPPPPVLRQLARGLLLTYTLHQFEEHAWDLKFRRYAFRDFMNALLEPHLGVTVTIRQVTLVNTITVWLGHTAAAVAVESGGLLVPAAFHWAFATFNAGAHLTAWLATGEYNPGVVQSSVQLVMGFTFLKQYFTLRKGGFSMVALLLLLIAGGPVAHFGGILWPLLRGLDDTAFAAVQVGVALGIPLLLTPILETGIVNKPQAADAAGSSESADKKTT
jgi:hypothetical protein